MLDQRLNRRLFLKAALAGIALLASERCVLAKPAPIPKFPVGSLSLYNIHNGERLQTTFRTPAGDYDPEALKAINWILRCHYTNEVMEIDVKTLEILNSIDKKLGGGHEIRVISGYRSPAYNSLLRREGRHVARHSLHLTGQAIDVHLPGIPLETVRRVALNLHGGGVGYYPGAGFVHVDSGPVRSW